MIDFFASATIALIVVMTLVIYFSNRRQAKILKQMRFVLEDWYDAKMRDRRDSFRRKFEVKDGLKWIGDQVHLNIVEQGRMLENPPAVEYFTTEGARLVVSPLAKTKLKSELRKSEGKRRKVAKLVEPLLGDKPRRARIIERSIRTEHEWFDLEIEAVLKKLKITWGPVDGLYFYLVPQIPEKKRKSVIIEALNKSLLWLHSKSIESITWIKQTFSRVSG